MSSQDDDRVGGIAAETEQRIEQFIHHTALPHTKASRILDGFIKAIGDAVSWFWLALVGIIVLNVVMRYVFGEGRIEFEELQWHLYAVGFLIGLSYCVQNDSHIRIDILHEQFRLRTKAWVELVGIVLFLIPYVAVVLVFSPQFIAYSFEVGEVSDAPGGLPYRWAIKAVMFIAYALILIAALSRLSRVTALLFGVPNVVARGEK
jgi:TRAP-type mannitol/chloroaromatic compound transport system permease small subunit